MSDRTETVLDSIDAELDKCICGNPIPADGPSLDYCSDVCQYRYTAEAVGTEPAGELTYRLPDPETDGRRINDEVNRRFRPGAETDDPYDGLMLAVAERLQEAARRAAPHLRVPDTRNVATFGARPETAYSAEPTTRDPISIGDYQARIRPGDMVTIRFPDGRTTSQRVQTVEGGRIFWAPTAAELDDGIDLTDQIAAAETTTEETYPTPPRPGTPAAEYAQMIAQTMGFPPSMLWRHETESSEETDQ